MRKAAKAWHLRFELIKMLNAAEYFIFSSRNKVKASKQDVYASQGEEPDAAATDPLNANGNNDWNINDDEAELPSEIM